MASAVIMPKMGLTMKEGTVNIWHKAEGDPVARDEDLVEIANDKVTNVLQSPEDGVLLKILVPDEAVVPVGAVLGWVGAPGEAIPEDTVLPVEPTEAPVTAAVSAPSPQVARPKSQGRKVSPAARKLAEANGLDLDRVAGTGPGGRVTREDVQRAIAAA